MRIFMQISINSLVMHITRVDNHEDDAVFCLNQLTIKYFEKHLCILFPPIDALEDAYNSIHGKPQCSYYVAFQEVSIGLIIFKIFKYRTNFQKWGDNCA